MTVSSALLPYSSRVLSHGPKTCAKSDHRRLAHFITERDEIPPCPPLQKGGSAQRGGISAGDCANVMCLDLAFVRVSFDQSLHIGI
jgi:hypothetical protein